MAKNVTITWNLPTNREGGGTLAPEEIRHVLASISADSGATYIALETVTPDAAQMVAVPDLEVGEWLFRFIVVDTTGQQSAEYLEQVDVLDDSPPNSITNVVETQT